MLPPPSCCWLSVLFAEVAMPVTRASSLTEGKVRTHSLHPSLNNDQAAEVF